MPLCLIGGSGTGKSHLLIPPGHHACAPPSSTGSPFGDHIIETRHRLLPPRPHPRGNGRVPSHHLRRLRHAHLTDIQIR
ncbi:hypothetical protein ACFC77_36865 [Nocardia colli]|uniref:hypothetical protein n=1 Tax=Nocardia colli TaxID=2545717 RepID=UPI0035DAACAF